MITLAEIQNSLAEIRECFAPNVWTKAYDCHPDTYHSLLALCRPQSQNESDKPILVTNLNFAGVGIHSDSTVPVGKFYPCWCNEKHLAKLGESE